MITAIGLIRILNFFIELSWPRVNFGWKQKLKVELQNFVQEEHPKRYSTVLTLIYFCGVRADPRQIETAGISQQVFIPQWSLYNHNNSLL